MATARPAVSHVEESVEGGSLAHPLPIKLLSFMAMNEGDKKVALVTGGSLRVGRAICLALHETGYRILIHYNSSESEAKELSGEMNRICPDSAWTLQADLSHNTEQTCRGLVESAVEKWNRLDVVVNNAANFFADSLLELTTERYDLIMNVNLKAPIFIIQAAASHLKRLKGCVINMVDIIGEYPTKSHFCYSLSKASLIACTKSAAQQLAPEVRVNAISPGCVLWPDVDPEIFDEQEKKKWLEKTPLERLGTPESVTQAIRFLVSPDASGFITGHILRLDGGRSLAVL